jgi:hypothetical protein
MQANPPLQDIGDGFANTFKAILAQSNRYASSAYHLSNAALLLSADPMLKLSALQSPTSSPSERFLLTIIGEPRASVCSGLVRLIIRASGGPEIPYRGGRVDALEPNAPGVPEPQQDLDAHIASFARQGFTKTEMIGLVACG